MGRRSRARLSSILNPATASKPTNIVPLNSSHTQKRLTALKEAGHLKTRQTSEPYFPIGWKLTDAGRETLDAARAPPELPTAVVTVSDTRPYLLQPAVDVDFESYFAGRPDAVDHDMVLGALARAVLHATRAPPDSADTVIPTPMSTPPLGLKRTPPTLLSTTNSMG